MFVLAFIEARLTIEVYSPSSFIAIPQGSVEVQLITHALYFNRNSKSFIL